MQTAKELSDLETGFRAIIKLATDAGIQVHNLLGEDPLEGVPDITFRGLKEALEADPTTYVSMNHIGWKVRNRANNGLLDCGAVVEVFGGVKRERPTFIIHHRKWVAHQRNLTN